MMESHDDEEMHQIDFAVSPIHDQHDQAANNMNRRNGGLFASKSPYSKIKSEVSAHDAGTNVAPSWINSDYLQIDQSSALLNKISVFSTNRPRIFGGCIIFWLLGLPLIIAVIALTTSLAVLQKSNSFPGATTTTTSSTPSFADYQVSSPLGVVATDNPICSQIGADILTLGGNAVDAAISATLCLGVISPASSGIGGGCYMLHYNQGTGESTFIDAREVAPSAATSHMFENQPMAAQDGGLAIAVLGEIRGLYLAYQKFSSKNVSWKQLVAPAAKLAESWVINAYVAKVLHEIEPQLYSGLYPELSKLYLTSSNTLKQEGDTVQQPKLAHTLNQIGEYGPTYLYETMAETLAGEIRQAGGIMTAQDISQYTPTIHNPISVSLANGLYQYLGVGGSSSGGPVVAGILQFMMSYQTPLTQLGSLYYHRIVEVLKHGFAMRMSLGDPDYVNATGAHNALLSMEYMTHLQSDLTNDRHVQSSLGVYGGVYNLSHASALTEDHGTSHISVVDAQGNALSMTSTINTYFGSKVVSPSTGLLFNNQMDDFSIPGASNYFGLAPSPYNYPAPGKKPLSSMSPSILLATDSLSMNMKSPLNVPKVRLVGGASGGPRIITATAQVILNYLVRGMDVLTAVTTPRVHSQLLPDKVDVEAQHLVTGATISMPTYVLQTLSALGHHNVTAYDGSFAITQFITIDMDTAVRTAVSDPRKNGKPAAQKP